MAKIITLTDLNEMEEEIFHYYLCAFPIQGLWAFKSSYNLDQKKLIVADILLDRKYDDGFINLNGHQFEDMLIELNDIKQKFTSRSSKENTEIYKKFMQNYELYVADISLISNPRISNMVKGIRGMRIRYEKSLYPKLDIFYALLRKKVAQQGKWSSVNAAIREVLPELNTLFLEYDQQQIKDKMASNDAEIGDCQETLKHPDNAEIFKYDKRHEYQKHLNHLMHENAKLRRLLELGTSPHALKKQSPFNTIYRDEVLMNHLRRNKKLLDEVIICTKNENA
ncbi:hypothetical protein [Acinetobacter venetianus]|uniref:hypothetical protein n=1 Tax=Acinetobacter venetianus TaxID=52133 RepID=UPI003A8E0210